MARRAPPSRALEPAEVERIAPPSRKLEEEELVGGRRSVPLAKERGRHPPPRAGVEGVTEEESALGGRQ